MPPLGVVLALLALGAPDASATHIACGDVITASVVLDGDLLGCPGFGLVLAANGITVDLNGHTIDGAPGSFWGIDGHQFGPDGITITNGTIQGFSHGIQVSNVTGMDVRDLTIWFNEASGIIANSSTDVTVERNVITDKRRPRHQSRSVVRQSHRSQHAHSQRR